MDNVLWEDTFIATREQKTKLLLHYLQLVLPQVTSNAARMQHHAHMMITLHGLVQMPLLIKSIKNSFAHMLPHHVELQLNLT